MNVLPIKSIKDLENVKDKIHLSVSYFCEQCGSYVLHANANNVYNRKTLLCMSCVRKNAKSHSCRTKAEIQASISNKATRHILDVSELASLKYNEYVSFDCKVCGALSGNIVGRLRQKNQLLCGDCMKKLTNLKLFGYEHASQRPEAKEHNRLYNMSHKDEINNLRKQSVQNKYGVDNVMKINNVKTKCFESNKNNHNGILAQQTEDLRNKQSERMLSNPEIQIKSTESNKINHGGTHSLALQSNRDKLYNYQKAHKSEINEIKQNTNVLINGKTNYMCYGSPEFNCAQFINFLNNYAVIDNRLLDAFKEWDIPTNLEFNDLINYIQINKNDIDWNKLNVVKYQILYNTTHPCSKPLYYNGIVFDSKWELMFYLYERDCGKEIIREPVKIQYKDSFGKTHIYSPDFSVNGELVEIKGSQFINGDDIYCPYKVNDRIQDVYKSLGKTIKDNNVKIISSNEIKQYERYVRNNYDINWINSLYLENLKRYAFSRYTFTPIYCHNTGVTPFDNNEIKGKGITPYDIIK